MRALYDAPGADLSLAEAARAAAALQRSVHAIRARVRHAHVLRVWGDLLRVDAERARLATELRGLMVDDLKRRPFLGQKHAPRPVAGGRKVPRAHVVQRGGP